MAVAPRTLCAPLEESRWSIAECRCNGERAVEQGVHAKERHESEDGNARLSDGDEPKQNRNRIAQRDRPAAPTQVRCHRDYHEQLVAGYHRTLPNDALLVFMPDLGRALSPASAR
jgi:hypothetical protein